MSAKHWHILIDGNLLRRPVSEKIGGVTVTSSASPYSVPDAVAMTTDKDSRLYVFELKYIGTEEPVETLTLDDLSFLKGKNSNRLFQVAGRLPAGTEVSQPAVLETVRKAIMKVASAAQWPIANSAVMTAVIDQTKEKALVGHDSSDPRLALGS
jgi:hypothetical protein